MRIVLQQRGNSPVELCLGRLTNFEFLVQYPAHAEVAE